MARAAPDVDTLGLEQDTLGLEQDTLGLEQDTLEACKFRTTGQESTLLLFLPTLSRYTELNTEHLFSCPGIYQNCSTLATFPSRRSDENDQGKKDMDKGDQNPHRQMRSIVWHFQCSETGLLQLQFQPSLEPYSVTEARISLSTFVRGLHKIGLASYPGAKNCLSAGVKSTATQTAQLTLVLCAVTLVDMSSSYRAPYPILDSLSVRYLNLDIEYPFTMRFTDNHDKNTFE
ncbi:hypothetical protein TNCV_3561631 [Trichonephila clavipes]|nr:hypothetical protein TNCV_3561631 [Trichonephila clavipes]